MAVQQQIFDLRQDGRSPVFQDLREVGGVAGVDSVRWRPEKENKLSTWVSNRVKPAAGTLLTFSPEAQFGSPSGAAAHGEDEEESGELHRHWRNLNGLVRAGRWRASAAAACSETKRRPGRVPAPVQLQDFQEPLVVEAQQQMWEQSCAASCAMTSHRGRFAREEGLLCVSGGLCNLWRRPHSSQANQRLWKLDPL